MPFIAETRQAIRRVTNNLQYAAGTTSIYQLPRTGMLARIYLHFSGTMTVTPGTGTATLSPWGPYNLFNRLRLIANQGTSIIDLSGFGAHVADVISDGKPYAPSNGIVSTSFAAQLYNATVNSGANDWEFAITLNVAPNDRDPIGMILLQTDQMAAELQVQWNQASGADNSYPVVLTGNATAALSNATVSVTLETFTIPAGTANKPDVSQIFQQLERQDPIAAVGDTSISLLRSDVYARIIHLVQTNGAPDATNISRGRLVYNGTDTPYDLYTPFWFDLQRRRYGRDLEAGVYVHDLFYQGVPGYGGQRDLVDAKSVASFESILTVGSGATINAANTWIRTVTQRFVQVQVPQQVAQTRQ